MLVEGYEYKLGSIQARYEIGLNVPSVAKQRLHDFDSNGATMSAQALTFTDSYHFNHLTYADNTHILQFLIESDKFLA